MRVCIEHGHKQFPLVDRVTGEEHCGICKKKLIEWTENDLAELLKEAEQE